LSPPSSRRGFTIIEIAVILIIIAMMLVIIIPHFFSQM
jgi:competence protein ComGC